MNNRENFMKWDNPGYALITGASSGIGAEFARELAKQGFNLILVARRKQRLENLSQELNNKYSITAEVLVADLSKMSDIEKVASKISNTANLDVLINNAGYGIFKHLRKEKIFKMLK
jgi:short-subunit dehydrogenase